jgi:hypothetical protein
MESKLDTQFLVNLAVPVPLLLKGVVAAANLLICSRASLSVSHVRCRMLMFTSGK